MTNLDTIQRWKQAAREGKAPDDARLFKEVAGAVVRDAAAPVDAPVTMVLSTAAVDRVGDTIAVDGWDLENYKRNPVVLWAHDSSAPSIGRMVNLRVESGALKGDVIFASKEYEFAATIEKLVRGGFLNAGSVGFRPLKYAFNEERASDGWFPPCDFIQQELLEHSVCPVPCNPEALVAGKSAGVDVGPIVQWAERVLSQRHGKGLWLPQDALAEALRGQAETTWKALRPPVVQVPATKGADDAPMACPGCAGVVEKTDKFCRACGKTLVEEPAAEEPNPEEPKSLTTDELREALKSAVAESLAHRT
jgi:HK97 family phage prohead protease